MDIIEKKDDEIDVEDVMRQVRDNTRKRKENSHHTKEIKVLINKPSEPYFSSAVQDKLQSDIDYLNSNWDVHAEYSISSHRPVLGRLLVSGRRLIHEEVRRFVDLITGKQSEFNARVARCIKGQDIKIDEAVVAINKNINTKVDEIEIKFGKTDTKVDEIDTKIDETVAAINKDIDTKVNEAMISINKDTDIKINEAINAINNDIQNKAWLANLLDKRIHSNITKTLPVDQKDNVMNYFLFEEKFRGSTEDIKKRQSIFLEYFINGKNVLDIGCGRGEFLSLLKEKGVGSKGIDINEDMVLYCRKNNLEVQNIDVLSYLRSLEDKSLDGIFSGQVVEHLQPDELISLIKLSYNKMQHGSYFIAETINPLSVIASGWFHMDLSHVRLIHPETIKFLLESVGFNNIEFKFFTPVPDELKLKKLEYANENKEEMAKYELINQNIDKLNQLLYGYQDYAIIGKK